MNAREQLSAAIKKRANELDVTHTAVRSQLCRELGLSPKSGYDAILDADNLDNLLLRVSRLKLQPYLVLKLKCYPNKTQQAQLEQWQQESNMIWNAALQERNEAYQHRRWHRSAADGYTYNERRVIAQKREYRLHKGNQGPRKKKTNAELAEQIKSPAITREYQLSQLQEACKSLPGLITMPAMVRNEVLDRLDESYENWLKGKDGKPHYRKKGAHTAIVFPTLSREKIRPAQKGKKTAHIELSDFGSLKIRQHRRDIDISTATQARIIRDGDSCFVCLTVPAEKRRLKSPVHSIIGVDMGASNLATWSSGDNIHAQSDNFFRNPQHLRRSEQRTRDIERLLSRKPCMRKKGAPKSRRAIKLLHKKRESRRKATRCVHDMAHKVSKKLVESASKIAIEENLNVQAMRQGCFSKAVHGAPMAKTMDMIKYKADLADRDVIEVNKNYTSQECPSCGTRNKLPPGTPYACECGYRGDRDYVAAYNICKRASS